MRLTMESVYKTEERQFMLLFADTHNKHAAKHSQQQAHRLLTRTNCNQIGPIKLTATNFLNFLLMVYVHFVLQTLYNFTLNIV